MVLIKSSYQSFKVSKIEINDGDKLESDKLRLEGELHSKFLKFRL